MKHNTGPQPCNIKYVYTEMCEMFTDAANVLLGTFFLYLIDR